MAVDLSGQVALVTGGSRGIGLAAAEALVAAGAKVAITARTGVGKAMAGLGGDVLGITCDVADAKQVEAAVKTVKERFGKLTLLINNAGVIDPIGPLAESDPAAWAQNIQINLTGAYHVARYVLPGMLAAGEGVIVNVSSGAAHRPLEGWSAYCTAKAGMAMFTRALHLETGARGVRNYGFAPGTVDTDMQVKIRASGINQISKIPRENLGGVAAPAACIAYLCSSAATDLAGEELAIQDASLRARVGLPPF
jgi:NAD(P)-dependent dehydrogenase (short-subunit alcohol dehydrogenase family)